MSAERNTAREWRRALARQNALANEIAAACASGRVPDRRLVAEWELASIGVFARRLDLSRKPQPKSKKDALAAWNGYGRLTDIQKNGGAE